MNAAPVLTVDGLRVERDDGMAIVAGLSLHLAPREILGVVGESGSGKSTTALALLGFARPGTRIAGGRVAVGGQDVLRAGPAELRGLRGRLISYVPQDAAQALSPALRIRQAIRDVISAHTDTVTEDHLRDTLRAVQLPADRAFSRRYPHELSGGQQQRVTIGMALACGPPVIVLDEPTTGLDVVTQAAILEELHRLRDEEEAAMLYVSHDLAVVAGLADRVAVMYAGRLVEVGSVEQILHEPRHPYTRGLVASVPDHRRPHRLVPMPGVAVGVEDRPDGCTFAPRCTLRVDGCVRQVPEFAEVGPGHLARCVRATEVSAVPVSPPQSRRASGADPPVLLSVRGLTASHRNRRQHVVAAQGVDFHIGRGECVALVGESASGKSTIARSLVGLHRPDAGTVSLDGEPLDGRARRRTVEQRRRLQYVFQNPYDSLNPSHTVAETLARPGQVLRGLSAAASRAEVTELLEQVRLPAGLADRLPRHLSGGERQRVAIARALAARPQLMVCDEITSALDVSVQAAVLELLAELQAELGLALLFITHDLGVVSVAADRILVLERGVICESGPVDAVLRSPQHDYTRTLLAAAPTLADAIAPAREA